MKHTKSKIIGLTGGIASGKSTVSSLLISKGYKVIDADILSREVVEIEKPAYKSIVEYFGDNILNDDKSLNRRVLGDLVFSNNELLQVLNNIIHPYIFEEIKKDIYKASNNEDIIFLDIPLLIESYDEFIKQGIIFDEIWLVYVDEDIQLKRLMERNNLSKEQAKERIEVQIPLKEKKEKATKVIDNNGSLTQLNINVEKLLSEFM